MSARQFGTLIGLVALSRCCGSLTPHFLTVSNLLNVAEQTSINAIVAVGMTFVILSGGIDLSVGSIVALSGVVLGTALQARTAAAASRCRWRSRSALACGLVNGALISWGGLPPFIVTLGMMSIARGAALLFTEGRPVSGFDASFRVARHRPRRLHSGAGRSSMARRLRRRALRARRGRRSAATSTRSAATRRRRACRACRSAFTRR